MILYYTHSYENTKGESHRLLGRAISAYAADTNMSCDASALTESLRTAGEFGKPYIPGFAPFSISHSGSTWAVLIMEGMTGECGLDIQYARKAEAVNIARRFYADEDAALIRRLHETGDESKVTDEFFRLWARREALVKAAGTSVAGTDIPAVSGPAAEYGGAIYLTEDINIPGADIYAAICVRCDKPGEGMPERLVIREL